MLAQCRHNLYRSPVDFVHEAEIVLVKSNESQVMDTFSRAQIDETTLPWLISSSSRMFKDWTIHSWTEGCKYRRRETSLDIKTRAAVPRVRPYLVSRSRTTAFINARGGLDEHKTS